MRSVYKKIFKRYRKILNKYNRNFNYDDNGIQYFITYLRYLRDIGLASTSYESLDKNASLVSLFYAINEYNESENCINNYYNVYKNGIERKDKTLDEATVSAMYRDEWQKHLDKSLNIIRDNFSNWVAEYGGKI